MKILVMMSGGTSPVINASFYGLISTSKHLKLRTEFYFPASGIKGIISDNYIKYNPLRDPLNKSIYSLPGSSILGTSRIGFLSKKSIELVLSSLNKKRIDCVVNIGGNGTFQQTLNLIQKDKSSRNYLYIPKTVDNDVGDKNFEDMYVTPGFPSAVGYLLQVLQQMNLENLGANSHEPVQILQTFGRDTGFLAGSVRLFDPQRKLPLIILIPEDAQPPNQIFKKIKSTVKVHGRALVVIAEGYPWPGLDYPRDPAGQNMYSSGPSTVAQQIAHLLTEKGITARVIIPTILQRFASQIRINSDRQLAYELGVGAIKSLSRSNKNRITAVRRKNSRLEAVMIDIESCNITSRFLQDKWINRNNFDVSDIYVNYLKTCFVPTDILSNPNLKPITLEQS